MRPSSCWSRASRWPCSSCSAICRWRAPSRHSSASRAAALVPWRLHDAAGVARRRPRGQSGRGRGRQRASSPACRIRPCCSTAPAASSISTRRRRSSRRRCARTSWRNSRCARRRSSPRCARRSRPRKPRRATYLDHVPVDRWMELIITPVPVPTLFGGADKCMLMTFHDQTPLRRVEEMRADFVANASHELRTPLAALSGFIDTLQGPARGRRQGARALSRHHARAGDAHGAADRRSAVAVAGRTVGPCPARHAGRSRADHPPGRRRAGAAGARAPGRHRDRAAGRRRCRSRATARNCCGCSRT